MAKNNEVLIYGEQEEGRIVGVTKELLGVGRRLAGELDGKLSVLIMGSGIHDSCEEAIAYGADKVYLVDHPLLAQYNPDSYTAAIAQVCQLIEPPIFLMGHTTIGRDIAGRVAFRAGFSPCMDCIKLEINTDSKSLVQTRLVYGGKAEAVIASKDSRPQLATVRPKAMVPITPDSSRKGEIENIEVAIDSSTIKTKLVTTVRQEMEGIKLEDADVIVAGGGGIGGADGFELLRGLAEILGGTIGTTRVPCDEGWVPSTSFEIGLTGKTVRPSLYITVGISGASQHVVGCSESKLIASINKDPEAAIFKVSNFGAVGDYRAILPELIAELKKLV